MSKQKIEKITVYFKNSFYGFDFFGYKTIKDLMESEGIKRSQVNSFYKHYLNYQVLHQENERITL